MKISICVSPVVTSGLIEVTSSAFAEEASGKNWSVIGICIHRTFLAIERNRFVRIAGKEVKILTTGTKQLKTVYNTSCIFHSATIMLPLCTLLTRNELDNSTCCIPYDY